MPNPAGRPKGSTNKTTDSVRTMARSYGAEAIKRLVQIMRSSDDEKAARAACNDLLNRAYGLPKQTVELEGELEIRSISVEFIEK